MRRYISLLVTLSITVLLGSGITAGQALSEPNPDRPESGSGTAPFAPGRILVKIEEKAPANAIVSVNRRNDARLEEKIPHTRVSVVDLPEDLSVVEAVERYEAAPEVEYAEPDYEVQLAGSVLVPNDPSFPTLYGLNNTGQTGGTPDADIDAPEAWTATTGSSNTVVAVIDTDVDINHPDLNDNVWTNPDEIAGNGKDDDGNGYADDVHGWDFANDDASVFDPADNKWHGTHVAGTIAAEGNNGAGVPGVAWQAKIMPLKFIAPTGHVSDAAEALRYAVDEGAEISNHSYGYYDNCGGCYSQTLRDAVDYADRAGHLVVAAAMNDGQDNDQTPVYPASHQSNNVISVAASDQRDALTSFSNYGATSVDLAAPGQSVYSTLPNNTYGYGTGTSMATPHVAGTAALSKSGFPELDDVGIKDKILQSVDRRNDLEGKLVSGGRLNAARALGVAVTPPPSTVRPPPNTVPNISAPRPAKTRDRTPTISARVWDAETNLAKTNVVGVYLDGRRITNFSYNSATDKLTFRSKRKLSYKRHKVRVIAQDPQGLTKTTIRSFRVVR